MSTMQQLKNFSPTPFDARGLGVEPDRGDWLVVVTRNRDSEIYVQSNFDLALERLQAADRGEDVEAHGNGHWACGWYEAVIVRPDSPAATVAEDILDRLESYPVLDSEEVSRREMDAYHEAMHSWGCRDFAEELIRNFRMTETDKELLRDADKQKLIEFFELCNQSGDYQEDGKPCISRSVRQASRDDVFGFIRELRTEAKKCESAFNSISRSASVLTQLPKGLAEHTAKRALKYAEDNLASSDPARRKVERAIEGWQAASKPAAGPATKAEPAVPRM